MSDSGTPGNPPDNDSPGSKRGLEELYEKMSRIFRENLEKTGNITEEIFEKSLKDSRDWAGKLKEHYSEDINKVSESIRRDWLNAVQHSSEQTKKKLDLDRIQAGVLGVLSKIAQTAGNQLESFAAKINERLTYKTGEIAGPGTLVCTNCGQNLTVEKPTRIPPCPKCHATQFRRTY